MKIATWNVNSVRMRIGQVCSWLQSAQPDVLLLQEIKCETQVFPAMEFHALGYASCVWGQKSYNGVALLSRLPLQNLREGLPDWEDPQARFIEAEIGGVTIASLYVPNGNPAGTEKYDYKINWINKLEDYVKVMLEKERPFVLGGDFNVIPHEQDVYDPKAWQGDALFLPEVRRKWRELINLGLTDAFRACHPEAREAYSFWDYQAGSWPQNKGLRIDHFLLSPRMADRLESCVIDPAPRGQDKASDHTPVLLTLKGGV